MPRANPDKGEATLGGRLFRMNFGAWRAFEHSSGRTLPEHMADLALGLSCDAYVAWLQAFAIEEISEAEIEALVNEAGFPEAVKVIHSLTTSYLGSLAEEGKNPPKAA